NLYHSLLSGQRALVLLDNAANLAQVKPLIPPAGCVLLVTSRQPIALPGMERIRLDELAPTEARELLLSLAARITPELPELMDQICYLCGYLPLAIRAAGSLLAVTEDLDVAEYTAQLKEERTRLASIGEEGVEIGVEASFNLSYARLNEEAARVFRGLCVFPGSFDARAEEAICEDTGHKHLSELVKRSLVLFEPTEQRYRLHDLVRVFAANRCSDTERPTYHQRHAEHFLIVLKEADRLYLQGGEAIRAGLALYDREWSNAQAAWAWITEHTETIPRALELCSEYPNASTYFAYLRQNPLEQIGWRETALAAAQKLGRKDAQGVHLGNLGIAYESLGQPQRAIEFYEQVLAIARETGDRRGEGQSLNNLGLAYAELGEPRRAIEFCEQSLTIRREIGDRLGEGRTLNNLGIAYKNLGEPQRAIEFYEQALPIRREIGDRRGEGATLGNLGIAYANLGEARRAIEFYEQQLAIAREIGDRRGEATALWNTAEMLKALGDRVQAITSAEAALVIWEQIESPYAAMVREQLAEWRSEGGAADE
ncbi:MAG: tetratricopeptide repeat protein, partial [Acidobacteria bacterium]|nr:tetratricopeptide repeat protein [Acidobacteriota bacterium]